MFNKFKKILLVILLLFSICSCKKTEEISNNNIDLIPSFKRYDKNDFYNILDELNLELENNNTKKVLSLYDKLLEEINNAEDMYTISFINSDLNTSNTKFNDDVNYSYDVLIELEDEFCEVIHNIALSDISESFRKHLDNEYIFSKAINYTKKSQELLDLYSLENKLAEEYESLDFFSDDFINSAGEIFVEQVSIRDKIAKLEGYSNYNEYADKKIYSRDYSSEELIPFYEASKRFSVEYENIYYYTYENLPTYDKSNKELLNDLYRSIKGVSDISDEAYKYLIDNELYYITDDDNSLDVAYTTSFLSSKAPIIYLYKNDSVNTVSSFVHEFGHFTNLYVDPEPYPVLNNGCYDLFEIHSTALQLLTNTNLSNIFNEKNMEVFNIANLISYVIDGCIYDEWQRKIYENPDMTIDEINNYYYSLCKEYGYLDEQIDPYYWMYINHNFSSPLYYISYAASAYVALQIWQISLDDFDMARDKWKQLVKIGGYGPSYLEVVNSVDLDSFINTDAVLNTLNIAYDYCLENLEVKD